MSLLLKTISIIAPAKCVVCGREGQELCQSCAPDLLNRLPGRCFRCQKLNLGSKTCSTCHRQAPLKYVWVAGEYEDGLKRAIKAFKFERQRGLARSLAEIMKDLVPETIKSPIIVHVPTATTRRRIRGYDHAERLASEVAKQTGWRHVPALRRQTQTRQVGARRLTRIAQLEGAFRVIRTEYARGREILLIDDVITTGATITACAKELKKAGAKSVSAVVLAQKS